MAQKFKLPQFRKVCAPAIYSRGREIFDRGGVSNLKKQGGEWSAAVVGTSKPYAVSVFTSTDDAEVTDWFCACPDEWNNPCKHVAALFFQLNDNLAAATTARPDAASAEKIALDSTAFKNPDEVLAAWPSLPKDEQKFLMLMALAWEPFNQAQVIEAFNGAKRDSWEANLTPQFAKHLADKYAAAGCLRAVSPTSWAVEQPFAEALTERFYHNEKEFFDKLSSKIGRTLPRNSWGWAPAARTFRDFRMARFSDDAGLFAALFESIPDLKDPQASWTPDLLLDYWLGPDRSPGGLADFPPRTRAFLANRQLEQLTFGLRPAGEWATYLLENLPNWPEHARETTVCAAAMLLFLTGDLDSHQRLRELLREPFNSLAFNGLEAIWAGRDAEAVAFYDTAAKDIRRKTGSPKAILASLHGMFQVLALLKTRETALFKKAENILLSKEWDEPLDGLLPCFWAAKHFLQNERGEARGTADGISTALPLGQFFFFLAKFWVTDGGGFPLNKLLLFQQKAAGGGYHLVAAECAAMLEALGHPADGTAFFEKNGMRPLAHAIARVPEWEGALQLLLGMGSSAAKQAPAGATRLVWLVNFEKKEIEPREQTFGKKGWSNGRAVSHPRLFNGEIASATEQDRRIGSLTNSFYGWAGLESNHKLWKAMVGHPLLFLLRNPDVAVQLVEERPVLQAVRTEGGGFQLRLSPPAGEEGFLIQKETPTRYRFYEITAEHARIARALGEKGVAVPEGGAAQLRAALGGLGDVVEVRSSFDAEDENIPLVEADAKTYVHLLPVGDGFQVEFFVKPFGLTPPYFAPGGDEAGQVALRDGSRIRTLRDLSLEKENAERARAALPTLSGLRPSGGVWELAGAEQCLELLAELNPLLAAGEIALEWPKGEKFRVERVAGFDSFRLSIREKNNWFEVTGQFTADEGRVLTMAELLEISERQRGGFVELSPGRFLALTAHFKKRLREIAGLISAQKDGSARLHPLAAGALAPFLDEVPEFEFDKKFEANRRRLFEAFEKKYRVPKNFKAELRPYQQEGFEWLHRSADWGAGCILADDMGLGKTIQCLAFLTDRAKEGPALVVAPASVCRNWMAETEKFAPALTPLLFSESEREKLIEQAGPGDLVIVTYDLLAREGDVFLKKTWATVVLDEAQAIKNRATKRSETVMQLDAGCRVLMSGTPVENHLGELWNLMQFANPGLLGGIDHFNDRFAIPIEKFKEEEARDQLRRLVAPFILRRRKDEVLKELPAKTEITLTVELSAEERAFYEALRRRALAALEADSGPSGERHLKILAEIMRLRRAACHPNLADANAGFSESSKLRLFGEVVEELLDNGHRALVFSQFTTHLAILETYLKKKGIAYQYLDGQTPLAKRQQRIEEFQSGKGDLFLISLKAGGTGLNLTAADYVIHMDPWWNPAVEDQATDRAHRIGQEKPVTVYRIVAEATIEEQIIGLHAHKRDLADALLSGADGGAKLSAEDLMGLLRGR